MLKKLFLSSMCMVLCYQSLIFSHCQMPCGIYHDDMVFDQIDQYIETTAKGITILQDSKFSTTQNRNEFMRWVMQKENSSNEVANLLVTYFLQQKIKPDEEDTAKRVISAHKMLFWLVQIKQSSDLEALNSFYEEWERFKLMFHIEGYECKMEQIKLKKWAEKQKQDEGQSTSTTPTPANSNPTDHNHDHDDHDHSH